VFLPARFGRKFSRATINTRFSGAKPQDAGARHMGAGEGLRRVTNKINASDAVDDDELPVSRPSRTRTTNRRRLLCVRATSVYTLFSRSTAFEKYTRFIAFYRRRANVTVRSVLRRRNTNMPMRFS